MNLTPESQNSLTFKVYLKHGQAPTMGELASFTFNDVVFPDDQTALKDMTFQSFVDVALSLPTKTNITLSYESKP